MRQKGYGDGLRFLRDSRRWEVEEAKFPWDLGGARTMYWKERAFQMKEVLCRFLPHFRHHGS